MSRKHNTQHRERGKSTYSTAGKAATADRYGTFDNGKRTSADRLSKPATSQQVTLAA